MDKATQDDPGSLSRIPVLFPHPGCGLPKRLRAGGAPLPLAPAAPREVGIEVVALENDTTLRWSANAEPDLAAYRIVWRAPGELVWRHARDAGKVTRYTLKGISKDNYVFGVAAVDGDGNASPASFARP